MSALAAHFDTIPAGTISVSNTVGQNLGAIDDVSWADIATGAKVFDFNNVLLARLDGEITDATGEVISWAGAWITVSTNEVDWIEGDYVNLPGWGTKPPSYKVGWVANDPLVFYTGEVSGTYQGSGMSGVMEDNRQDGGHVDLPYDFGNNYPDTSYPQAQFKMYWDMTNYDISNPLSPSYGQMWGDFNDPNNTDDWYSVENGGALFPDVDGINVGRRHGSAWDQTDPMYYNDYTDTVISISLVEDNVGGSATCTFSDITFDVVGRLTGDAELDGDVDMADRAIVVANLGSTDAHWGMGDFTGGGSGDWGGLDGKVDAEDMIAINKELDFPDFNGDGPVDVSDLGILATSYDAGSGMDFTDGDANGDGLVDVSDLGILATNYDTGGPAAAVPEPATLALLVIGALGLLIYRKR
ncbi:MAG: PEP-CTERM sorting domain-containing protein [Planctomycetota bacterium]|nr:PEP-CTERM sorting domain-containing protein [Planctomycetota bacterium]